MLYRFLFLALLSVSSLYSDQDKIEERVRDVRRENLVNSTLQFAKGHQLFRDLYFEPHEESFVRLVKEGQSPKTLFIGCSDSRILPNLMMSAKPGELFVIRTAGNFVPPYDVSAWGDGVSATIQYAVEAVGVKHIIICGHSHCGAIEGLFKNLDDQKMGIVKKWLRFGQEAKEYTLKTVNPATTPEEMLRVAEHISVLYQLEHLMTFPFIQERVKDGSLTLHGWYFRIETGDIEFYDPESYRFIQLRTFQPTAFEPVRLSH